MAFVSEMDKASFSWVEFGYTNGGSYEIQICNNTLIALKNEIQKVIVGQEEIIELLLVSLFLEHK